MDNKENGQKFWRKLKSIKKKLLSIINNQENLYNRDMHLIPRRQRIRPIIVVDLLSLSLNHPGNQGINSDVVNSKIKLSQKINHWTQATLPPT